MVKYTQTIRQQYPTNFLSVFDYFVGLALKGLRYWDSLFLLNWMWVFILNLFTKTSNTIGALIDFTKFFSSEVLFHLFKSVMRPCMEYCCLGLCLIS